jgi:splicing suppressor protein 51
MDDSNFLFAKMLAEDLDLPFDSSFLEPICAHCRKREPENATREQKLLKCSRCQDTLYCSRECQVADWKRGHKVKCKLIVSANKAFNEAAQRAEVVPAPGPNDVYLDSIPTEEEAMDRLIDAYRLRVEDDYVYKGDGRGLYGLEDPYPDFRHFLNLAEKRKGVLPKWWNKTKRKECERRALNEDNWCCISYAVEKSDIQEHYKDNFMPMTLRMLAEKIYGQSLM